ncbi:MAG: hypothetical protein H6Q14_462 [Bacteroidetes bacterium]|nr:hypothetical protein [Bacteroidota bacterium]
MKQQTFSLIFFLLLPFYLYAQKTKLPESKRFSEKAYIYKKMLLQQLCMEQELNMA